MHNRHVYVCIYKYNLHDRKPWICIYVHIYIYISVCVWNSLQKSNVPLERTRDRVEAETKAKVFVTSKQL